MDFQNCANCLKTLADNSELRACNDVLTNDIERRNTELVQAMQKIDKLSKDLKAIQVIVNGTFEPGEGSKRKTSLGKPRQKLTQKSKTCECSGGCKNKRCGCFRLKLQCSISCRCKCGHEHQDGNVHKTVKVKTEFPDSFVLKSMFK